MKKMKPFLIGLFALTCAVQGAWSQASYDYWERSWDGTKVITTTKTKASSEYGGIGGSHPEDWGVLYDGWYVVMEDALYHSLVIQGTDVHLIIPDGKTLTVTGGVRLMKGHKLSIYSQGGDVGVLNVTNDYEDAAGIGSATVDGVEQAAGELVIHGGIINATGGKYGAGIGSGAKSIADDTYLCNTVTVYGGTVTAVGGVDGAGIGGGTGYDIFGNHGGTFILYGGTVVAQGGSDAAGVGGGGGYSKGISSKPEGGRGGAVHVYGGNLRATGGSGGAGIGSGEQDNPVESINAVDLHVYGGKVQAQGGNYGAGIGGGHNGIGGFVTVSGGEVYAYGGKYGAGIGGGENSRGGSFRITDGYVLAKGSPGAAGIGGGDGTWGFGGQNYILGGTVIAEAGTQGGTGNRALGPGDNIEWENDNHFSLEIDNEMTVYAGNEGSANLYRFTTAERVEACKYRSYARIEPCTHEASTTYVIELEQHKGSCAYCNLQEGVDHVLIKGQCNKCKGVILNDDSENHSILNTIVDSPSATVPAVYIKGRTLSKDGHWNTLCLPFKLDNIEGTPLEGATVKPLETATFSNGTLTLNFGDAVTNIVEGKAYIVKWETPAADNVVNPKFENVNLINYTSILETPNSDSSAESVITFRGTLSPFVISGEDKTILYLGADDKIYYPNSAMTIGSFRAYFVLNGLTAGDKISGINHSVLNFGDETNSIENEISRIENGAGAWFTLDGRKLSDVPKAKGIYINNGHKVVIK